MAQEKERIFISYKRVDKERVFAIKDGIEQATGEKCWIDLDGIESDAQFSNVIVRAINRCEVFLFMYSKEHTKISDFEEDWTIKEITFAKEKKKRIVIINIDDTPLIDQFLFEFPRKQRIDASDISALARLNKDLCEWLGVIYTTEQTPTELEQAKRNALPKRKFRVGDLMYKASEKGTGVTVCGRVNRDAVEIHIPSQIKYGKYTYEVTSIGNSAFEGCSGLTSITIPNSVKSIGGWAFYNCSCLASITIPNSVTSIGNGAVAGCKALTSITIPNSVTSIRESAFDECKALTSITIPNSVTSIGSLAFYDCTALASITIPNSVTSIGYKAFCNCNSLTSIVIPNSVTSIGVCVFCGCNSLTSIVMEEGNNTYDSRENCNAIIETTSNTLIAGCKNTIIPNSVTSIGDEAFRYCTGLISITIPSSVTSIGDYAFKYCSSLESITIPKSLTDIGENAFPEHTKIIRK